MTMSVKSNHDMEIIKISSLTTKADLELYSKIWKSKENVAIEFVDKLSEEILRQLIPLLINRLPDDFSLALLCDLAEIDDVPQDLLMFIFENGDTACKVSVCLRGDLNESIMETCKNSNDPNVQAHLRKKMIEKDQ
jgi:hypothetical protein